MGKGYIGSIYGSLYNQLFGQGGKADLRFDYMNMLYSVRAIRESGGKAFLAHPFLYNSLKALTELIDSELMGTELVYPTHTLSQIEICAEVLRRYGFAASGGADYHDVYGERKDMPGDFGLDPEGLQCFLDRVIV